MQPSLVHDQLPHGEGGRIENPKKILETAFLQGCLHRSGNSLLFPHLLIATRPIRVRHLRMNELLG
jgi:hypothetical protein